MADFPKTKRLRCKREFQQTFDGRKAVSRDFVVYCQPRADSDNGDRHPSRVGIIVSKRVHRHANKRNFIKRKIREACREVVLPEVEQQTTAGADLIVIARASVWNSDLTEFDRALNRLTRKALGSREQTGAKRA